MAIDSKMKALVITASLMLAGVGSALGEDSWPGVDWPNWRGPNHDGTTTESIATTWPKDGPPKLWEKPIGHGYSTVIVCGERVITLGVAAGKENAYCLNAATGAILWQTAIDDKKGPAAQTTPATDGKTVVAISANGRLVALDFASGNLLWGKSLHDDLKLKRGAYYWGSSPLLHKNLAIINSGLAFNITTGEIAWENKALRDNPKVAETYSTPVPVKLDDKIGVLVQVEKALICLDPDTGVEIWKVATGSSSYGGGLNNTDPVVVGDKILCGGAITRFTAKGAQNLARLSIPDYIYTAVVHGQYVYKMDRYTGVEIWPKNQFYLHCFNLDEILSRGPYKAYPSNPWLGGDRELNDLEPEKRNVELQKKFPRRWIQMGAEDSVTYGTLSIAGDTLVHLTHDGELVLVKASEERFQQLACTRVFDIRQKNGDMIKNHGVFCAPVVSHGRLYCRSFPEQGGDKLVCFDVRPKP